MVSVAPQEFSEAAAPPEEGGARAAILAAARKVAEREGVIEMTLTGVAKEATVAAGEIYALFSSKNDLLQAVVADDLANLAKTMRRSFVAAESDQTADPASGHAPSLPLAILATGTPVQATNEPVPETTQSNEIQGSSMSAAPAQQSENQQDHEPNARDLPLTPQAQMQELSRRYPVVQARRDAGRPSAVDSNGETAEAIAQLRDAVAKLESRPVDQWLERRLREFERGLAALQDTKTGPAAANASVEQELQGLRDAVEALKHGPEAAARGVASRIVDEIEKNLREKFSDLEAENVHLARRITALENLALAPRPEATAPMVEAAPAPAPDTEATPAYRAPVEPFVTNSVTGFGAARKSSGDAPPSFLNSARRSAMAAEKALEEMPPAKNSPPKSRRLLYMACGSLLLFVVMLAVTGSLLHSSVMNAQPILEQTRPAAVTRPATVTLAPRPAIRLLPSTKPLPHAAQSVQSPSARRAVDTGDASAELLLGLQYLEGRGVAKNQAMAVDWLSRAAAKGQPVAQYDLGALYADGRGVPADAVQAFQWFGAAALRGNRRAMHFLAIAYAEGVGTSKNLPEAARWFERSATLGAVNSQFNIAVLYERGMGVPQNLQTAYKWYSVAAAQGDREARARVAALAATLKPESLTAAKAAADSFKPEPLDPAANIPPKFPS